ncbi:glycoside hydrolase family 73 protein [Clostridium paraputrificum]|uniref:glycoside hydrolase family 73 protein n=1 Tax=Clostridium paraputrificum TaxID=29363 RepID=UPI00232C17BC|nr:glucosaminidase domain-containing protein [Clostridium paraputrificum]MDB2105616.1 glucosaminidase domain-containing protein [Clostridium paraputrificum]MDB2112143.1 glucosaminidase domain-containing protein [Clostridium paraputrificum]
MVKRRRKVYKRRKINRNKYKFLIRRVLAFILLVTFFIGLKYILTNKKEFISSESINDYIEYVDSFSGWRKQLNWKEVAAIDGIKNIDFNNINKKKIEEICKWFYDEDNNIKDFEKVIEGQNFTDKERKKAEKNLKNLSEVSLRNIRGDSDKEKDKLIENMKSISIDNYKKSGVLPSVTISQAILESNWGKSELSAKYNNYFGIKASAGWNGKIATFSTKENYNDTIKANFRAYDSLEESVNDLGNFLNVNSRYRKHGLFDGKNYIEQAQALEDAGYSTKKNSKGEAIYADLLIELIKDNNLMIIDSEAVKNE